MSELGSRTYPFPGFRFEVRLDAVPVGGFSECGGLRLHTEIQDFAEGGLNTHVHKLPVRITQSDITLRRGVADRVLWDWYAELAGGVVRREGPAAPHLRTRPAARAQNCPARTRYGSMRRPRPKTPST